MGRTLRIAALAVGLIAVAGIALAKAAGAGKIVAFEVSKPRLELAKAVGADYAYDPREVHAGEVLMELSGGAGFDFHVEAAGVPELTIPEMEEGLAINSKIVQIGRAAKRVPMYLESFQVRRAQAFASRRCVGTDVRSTTMNCSAGTLSSASAAVVVCTIAWA